MPIELEDEDYSPTELASIDAVKALTAELPEITLIVPLALSGKRLDQALAELFPDYSRSRLSAMVKDGVILLDGVAAQPKTKLLGGETIVATLTPREEELAFKAENVPINAIFEDDSIIVIDKPAGLVVHPGAGNWSGTLLNGLLARNPQVANLPRAGIVHRLDKDTSGVMVAAKTEAAQLSLVRQLQARTMKRIYNALVRGYVKDSGTVDAPIDRHPRERTKMAVIGDVRRGESNAGKSAVTHYRPMERYEFHSLLECSLETGRTHQIRVHMQTIGFPLEGDPVYGPTMTKIDPHVRDTFNAFGRQALHARRLTLIHPATSESMTFESPLPEDMLALIEFVREL
jgi:23S rRNA pseudouridine1911/1915/1917 synthase